MAALSRFVSASGEKGHPYFQCLRRNNKFVWTKECEEAFVKLKEYLASPPVLCKPLVGTPLRLYFAVTERVVSAVLAQDQDQAQKPIYCEQGVAGPRNEISGPGEGCAGCGIFGEEVAPLLP